MSKRPTLLQHFRSFAYQNNITNFDVALEYFTVFGGTRWDVDSSKSVDELIKEKILCNYEDFSSLLDNLSEKDLLVYKNKKY